MRRLPSVKTLEKAFPGKGKKLREALEMSKAQLSEHPAGKARIDECYHMPSCFDIRMHVLDSIAETCGVEYASSPRDTMFETVGFDYLNVGDSYGLTIVRSHATGNYRVACVDDLFQTYGFTHRIK